MSMKILLINPNKWGRGITSIWIPSHVGSLKALGYDVKLFDATFYKEWSVNEVEFNTANKQYKPTEYESFVNYMDVPVVGALQKCVDEFSPDIIFWSAISSHIHGEGEYVNIQYGYELVSQIKTKALLVTSGLQATAVPSEMLERFPKIDYLICGYSEKTLCNIVTSIAHGKDITALKNIAYTIGNKNYTSEKENYNINDLPKYDYSLFDEQVFWRPYNGEVLKAVDYEMSRGCIYSCEYCVETIIQDYYGYNEHTSKGSIKRATSYVQTKTVDRIFDEISDLVNIYDVQLIRCQDTNFLTMDRKVLQNLAKLVDDSDLDYKLYIETRPEGINETSVSLLKSLNVDGVGMGIELSSESFREDKLMRYASTTKIYKAFKLLKENGIKRTAYNIIGLPEQDEESIKETILFNQKLAPDNITVAFYSPYHGTKQQVKANELGYFDDYEYHVDGQLRTMSKYSLLDNELLIFYKKYFVRLVVEGLDKLDEFKEDFFKTQS